MGLASRRRLRAAPCLSVLILVLTLVVPRHAGAQSVDFDELEAAEEFGWGVRAFHRGYFQDAIRSFTRSLSLDPENALTREWLGRAYFRAGLEQAAMSEWGGLLDRTAGSLYIEQLLDQLTQTQLVEPDVMATEPYVNAREIDGRRGEIDVFRRPTSVLSRDDGSLLVVSFGTHEISVLDVNGARIGRWRGGAIGFDAPYDIVESGGDYFVTEFAADRISRLDRNGNRIATFAESGIGNGQLIGPQYIDADGRGYLYVSDYGNRRVVRFNEDGEYIHAFGDQPEGAFPGLREPTGIAWSDGTVYVADSAHNAVFAFDESGNFRETLGEGRVDGIEGLSVYSDRELLLGRRDRVDLLDVERDTIRPISELDGAGRRVISALREVNGDIVAVDFDANVLFYLTERPALYTGLRTQVERIDSDSFPSVVVDVRVEDRNGNPIVGLRGNNFVITEEGGAVDDASLIYAADRDTNPTVSLLVSRGTSMANMRGAVERTLSAVHESVTEAGEIGLILSGREPIVAHPPTAGFATFVEDGSTAGAYDGEHEFDRAARLAAGELMRVRGRRSVTYLSDGTLPDDAFDTYDLVEVASYMRNNGIRFDLLLLGSGEVDDRLEYLVEATSGMVVRPEDTRGLLPYEEAVIARPSGRYVLRFTTPRDGDFGRRYLPLEVEAALGRRTGRAESGYFAPFEF